MLIGDAAHATSAHMGMGGGMALEDAVGVVDVLAEQLLARVARGHVDEREGVDRVPVRVAAMVDREVAAAEGALQLPPLQVLVSNGDLRYATYPLLAGHFATDGILYADRLDDASRRVSQRTVRRRKWGVPGQSWLPGRDHLED